MSELLVRFALGGTIVSLFAVLGDVLQPKTFAGIFGAAPSVALATLGLAYAKHGGAYAARQGSTMMSGAVALLAYSLASARAVRRKRPLPTWLEVALLWALWLAVALGTWRLAAR